jgi:hypothetical protein
MAINNKTPFLDFLFPIPHSLKSLSAYSSMGLPSKVGKITTAI